MVSQTEEAQLRAVEDGLVERFRDAVPLQNIHAAVAAARADLADARVRTFVPVLVERRATDQLRHAS